MIQIKVDNLDEICQEYSKSIFQKFSEKIITGIKLTELLVLNRPIVLIDIKGCDHNTLYSFVKRIFPKETYSKSIKQEKLIKMLNDKRVSNDKRSVCRKSKDLRNLKENLKSILLDVESKKLFAAKNIDLINLQDEFTLRFSTKISDVVLSYVFDYKLYTNVINNKLAKVLNLKVCPYCNRNFITYLPTDNDQDSLKKVIRPTYDHFYYKEKYTFLTLCFYNLIPSCSVCNSNLKLKKEFHHEKNINPYTEGFGNDAFFDFNLFSDLSTKQINFIPLLVQKSGIGETRKNKIFGNNTTDDSGNIRVFKLQEIYETHFDTVEEIHMNFDEHNDYYVHSIKEEIQQLGTSESEFYRFHFKNYFDEVDFNKRPLAKLTKDIYTKMKEIILTT